MTRILAAAAVLLVLAAGALGAAVHFGWPPFGSGEAPSGRPVPITVEAPALEALLASAPSVSRGGATGPVVYVLSFRSCPTCLAFKAAEYESLLLAGADVRWILYARQDRPDGTPRSKPGERAMVAALWETRSYALFTRWFAMAPDTFYETQELPPSADDGGARARLVAASRELVAQASELLARNDVDLAIPALVWRDARTGGLMVSIGYSAETFPEVRESLFGPASGLAMAP